MMRRLCFKGIPLVLALCAGTPVWAGAPAVCSANDPGNPVTGGGVVNSYYPGIASVLAGATSIPVGALDTSTGGAAVPIAAGDMILVIQMQDADIVSTNTAAYGSGGSTGSGYTAINRAGQYEYVIASGPVSGGAVPIGSGLTNAYRSAVATGTKGQSTYQVIRVPRYSSLTASGITAAYWNGLTGGVVALDVAGTLSGSVNADGRGYRGGGGRQLFGDAAASNADYASPANLNVHGQKGEGIAGTPQFVYNQQTLTVVDTAIDGYPNGSSARGAPGNAGGGGTDGNPPANDENSGGGGGGNGGAGGQGGFSWNSGLDVGGRGGAIVNAAIGRVVPGGGGGAGSRNNSTGANSSGGAGGGIVLIRAGNVSAATISANGAVGSTPQNDGGGGGGAGGSIVVTALSGSFSATANGARGTDAFPADGGAAPHGPGGGGGGGVVLASTGLAVSATVSGGANGTTTTTANIYGAAPGSTGQTSNSLSESAALGANSGSQCVPQLSVTKTTVPTGPVTVNPGGTVTYRLIVSNAATVQTATQVALSDTLPGAPTPFTNASATPIVVLAGGATRPATTNAAVGSTTPSWSNFTLPAGGSVQLDFNVTVPIGTTLQTYQNTGTATYLDARRTTNTGTTSASSNPASTANEDVKVVAAPTATKTFLPASIGTGGISVFTLTLSNSNATAISGAAFTDTYPAGLSNTATPAGATTCTGGTVTAANNGTSLALAGATIPANGSCSVTVNVTAATAGNYANTIPVGGITTTNAGSNTAAVNATLQVLNRPTATKAFSPASIGTGGTSVLTVTLLNSNATAISGAAFTDTYPGGLTNTATPAGTTTCAGGTVTAANNGNSLALSGGAIPANGSCTVTVNVTTASVGSYANTIPIGGITTTNAGSNIAAVSGTLTVLTTPAATKAFTPSSIATGVVSTLTFTLTNSNAVPLTGVAFSDVYPAGLVNAGTPNLTNACGGTATGGISGGNNTGLTGGTIPANSSCTVRVDVTSNAGGSYNNVSGAVSSANGGTGNTASATLTVINKPSIGKSFAPTSIAAGGTSTLAFTITNANATALTGAAFTDAFPAGLTVAVAPALSNTCGGTISGGAGGNNFLSLTNGNVAASGTCTITVAVTASSAGTYNNTASGVSSTQSGSAGATSNIAQLTVVGAPSIAKAFSPTVIGIGGTSTLTFTLTNNNAVALTGVAFNDTYPANLVNAGVPTLNNSCGGTATGLAGGNTVALAGGSIPANSTCTVSIQVTSGTTGTYNNVSGAVTATNGGAGNAASASLTVSANPSISKAFSPSTIPAGGVSTVTFVLSNTAIVAALNSSFTDNLPSGMVVASPASSTNACGGTVSATSGSATITLANGSIPALGNCAITVNVAVAAAGTYLNTTTAVSSALGSGSASNTATLVATAPATISKSFSPATILANGASTLSFVINNPNGIPLTGMAFTDNFPSGGLQMASAPNVANNCGGTVSGATPGSTSISLASGTLAAGASCTISVVVTSPIPGNFSNTTTGVSTNETNTGTGANAVLLTVVSPDLRLTKNHSGSFTVGTQGTYTLTVDNVLGTAATSGAITVTDTLPAGLTYIAAGSGGTGWSCSAAGQVITCTSSAVIAAGASSANPITINVSVAATAVPGVTNSASVSGGSEPAVNTGNNNAFDPTVVVTAAQNTFAPDGVQTASPGTTVFYPHTFNAGIAGSVGFSTVSAPSPAVAGWGNVIYRDSNCNGVLDGTEGNTPLTGNISVNPGDTICIVVKEFVPAGAPYNAKDVITVTAAFTPVTGPVVTYSRTDTTTVGNAAGAGLTLAKTVRNVTTGGAAGTNNAAKPGETLEYTITYTNNGADPLATIVINDGTPAFTNFVSAGCGVPLPANISACNVTTQPVAGAAGAIVWTLSGPLASTASGTVIFRVQLQ